MQQIKFGMEHLGAIGRCFAGLVRRCAEVNRNLQLGKHKYSSLCTGHEMHHAGIHNTAPPSRTLISNRAVQQAFARYSSRYKRSIGTRTTFMANRKELRTIALMSNASDLAEKIETHHQQGLPCWR
jgi:hypothetical protein